MQEKREYIRALVRHRRCQRGGFTLVELLLVVALIALVSGLSGGFYMGTYKRIQVEKVVRDFVLTAKYARIMAIEKRRSYEIQIDEENGVL